MARDEGKGEEVRGFIVPTDSDGFVATAIEHKLSIRASIQCDISLDDVAVGADALLHNNPGLRGPFMCLGEARLGISFGALGAAHDSLEAALTYATERHQFDQPIASYQLTQEKLANMALELNKGQLLALSPLIFVPLYHAHPVGAFVICCAALNLITLMQVKVKP